MGPDQLTENSAGVAVVTDSTPYVPAEMLRASGVRQVDLYVGWGGERKAESSYDLDDFYLRLRESDDLPTTSQPSVGDFLEVYRPLTEAGRDVISIHMSSALSGTYDSALEAAQVLEAENQPGRVEVVDSETGAGGLGCMVTAATRSAAEGNDLRTVARDTRESRNGIEIWFCLDTLEYLRKGGRIGAAQALVGTALRIKPVLTFGTEISPVGKVRTRARARERMASYLDELRDRGATDWIIQHAQSPDDAAFLVERGTAVFGAPPLFCTQVGPVLGAHLGSGMLVGGMGCLPHSGI